MATKDKHSKRLVYSGITVDHETGEVTREEYIHKNGQEPKYVKLYIDTVLTFKGLSKSLNPIILEFLSHMHYADGSDESQVIYTNKAMKDKIAQKLGISNKRIDQALTAFVKAGVFHRVATGTYQVNPYVFGRGDWSAISDLRNSNEWVKFSANFNFVTGEIHAEIEPKTEDEGPEQLPGQMEMVG